MSPAPVVNYEYDANGNPTRTIQAPGLAGFAFATTRSYDALGRLKDSTDARSGVTRFDYNGREDLTQITDPRSLPTQYPRNGLGDATGLLSPDTGTAGHTHDAAGNLTTRTDSRGVLATYSYDALNRLTQVVYSKSGSTSIATNGMRIAALANFADDSPTKLINGLAKEARTSDVSVMPSLPLAL